MNFILQLISFVKLDGVVKTSINGKMCAQTMFNTLHV